MERKVEDPGGARSVLRLEKGGRVAWGSHQKSWLRDGVSEGDAANAAFSGGVRERRKKEGIALM